MLKLIEYGNCGTVEVGAEGHHTVNGVPHLQVLTIHVYQTH